MFQNAGTKGERHRDPADPPRRRANKKRGRGTKDNARPPILGIVGRRSQLRLRVGRNTQQVTIQPQIENATLVNTILYTDESDAYNLVQATGRGHGTVCHSAKEYARDDDGDGIREVHCNTLEGIWAGLRNFLRPFRGIHQDYLAQYVAMFEWEYNLKIVNHTFLRTLLVPSFT